MIALRIAALATLVAVVAAAPTPRPWDGGDAYTGVGGQAVGGSVYGGEGKGLGLGPIKALNINSGNSGNGGDADSGVAVGGKGGDKITKGGRKGNKKGSSGGGSGGGNAYTGNGGQASGGNVYGEDGISFLNIGSGNAGDAGSATSGSSFGGDAGKMVN